MIEFELNIYSHYFTLSNFTSKAKVIVDRLNEYCTQRGYIRSTNTNSYGVIKVFNSCTSDGQEVHYHITLLQNLRDLIITFGFKKDEYIVKKHDLHPITYIDAPIRDGWVPRDYQEPIIEYIEKEGNNKFIGLSTGKGKTSIALMAISHMKMKTLILIKPTYIDKWVFDVSNVLDVDKDKVNVIQGSDSLYTLIEMNKQNIDESKFIIMSISTYHNFITLYEKYKDGVLDLGYGCTPAEFLETCGIGVVLIDEIHQLYFQQFQAILYMNCYKLIALSATFFTKDKELESMYELGFPLYARYKETLHEKYIYVTAISYNFHKPEKIRYTEYNSTMYSQSAFEKSIMKHVPTCEHYVDMVCDQVERAFISRWKPGDKCIIFAFTIKMCLLIRDRLRSLFPDFSCEKFTGEDPYDNIIKPTIRVTTIGSGGTAIDIPNLTTAIMTVNIDSLAANRQSIGRLRKLKDRDVFFYYLFCSQIDKHRKVHYAKRKILSPVAANFAERHYGKKI